MGYPTGIFAPPTRTNGQTIDASHINDLQDELIAVETQLLGTITHALNVTGPSTLGTLQAGPSTVTSLVVTLGTNMGALQAGASTHTSLSVSGGSTLASLVVSGGSTLTTLQAAASTFSVRPVTPPPDAAQVYLGSTYTAASSALSTLAFTAQTFLTNSSIHSTGTNPARLTPQSTGLYQFVGQITLAGAPTGASVIAARFEDSSATVIAQHFAQTAAVHCVQAVGFKRFDVVGGYATFIFRNVSGGSTISLSSGIENNWFSMVKL